MLRLVIRGINPEPWAIGTVNCYAKGKGTISPNPKVVNYQLALREEILNRIEITGIRPAESLFTHDLSIWYWRSTERGHPADVTNLNKSTEDALQGILYANDASNRRVVGEIVEQHSQVEHVGLIIILEDYNCDHLLHDRLSEEMVALPHPAFQDTDYEPPDQDYI